MPVLVRLIGDGEALGDHVRRDCNHARSHDGDAAVTLQVGAAGMRALVRAMAGSRRMILVRVDGFSRIMRMIDNGLLSDPLGKGLGRAVG